MRELKECLNSGLPDRALSSAAPIPLHDKVEVGWYLCLQGMSLCLSVGHWLVQMEHQAWAQLGPVKLH